MRTSEKTFFLFIIFISIILFWIPQLLILFPVKIGSSGTVDFIEYWSAYRLYSSNQNPYDPELIFTIQKSLGYQSDSPLMMWLPPIALLILRPFLIFSFEFSVILFYIFNLLLIFLISYQLHFFVFCKKKLTIESIIISFFFIPVLTCIDFGQISLVLLLSISSFLYFYKQEKYKISGASLSILFLKPHFFLIFGFSLILWSIKQKNISILGSALVTILFLSTLVYFENGDSLYYWIKAIIDGGVEGAIRMKEWKTASVSMFLREIWGYQKTYLMWVPTLIGMLLTIFLDFKRDIFKILGLSFALAPYGWLHDQVFFLVIQFYLFYLVSYGSFIIVIIQILYFCLNKIPGVTQEFYALMLIFWLMSIFLSKKNIPHTRTT